MTDATLLGRIDSLEKTIRLMASSVGQRLTAEQFAARLSVSRSTFAKRRNTLGFPKHDVNGRWLLSEIMDWEKPH